MSRYRPIVIALALGFLLAPIAPTFAAERFCQRAEALQRPAGAPQASEVIMRSLRLHRRGIKKPYDTWQALQDFHVTMLAWAYINDPQFIAEVKASGRTFGGAASAPSYIAKEKADDWFERVVVVDAAGKPIIAPWKRTWSRTLWGCMNNPELERGYLQFLKEYIDAGAQIMQRDEPEGNHLATRWGGCFCDHCMAGFRQYVGKHMCPTERAEFGISDPDEFDYRKYLQEAKAPVGDAFGNWDGGKLKDLFVEFQQLSTLEFHQRIRKALNEYAGRTVPFSCNNGVRRFDEIELAFDWVFGELSYGHATAYQLYDAFRTANEHNLLQIVTMPKKGNYDNPEEWQRRTRNTIAMSYACGNLCMVPWDVYMPHDAPRYFGTPDQYADLFGFIRANKTFLNGYAEAAAVGAHIPTKFRDTTGAVQIVGNEGVCAIVRAIPGDSDAPLVIHLVDWSEEPQPFSLQLDPACCFGGRPLKIRLLQPTAFDGAAHAQAETSGDFSSLTLNTSLGEGFVSTVKVPALGPWGIVVIEPAASTSTGVWQPRIWADPDSYYANRLTVKMDCASTDAEIRYTTDGKAPTKKSKLYAAPIVLNASAAIQATAFAKSQSSPTATAAFTKDEKAAKPLLPSAKQLSRDLKLWLKADTLGKKLADGDAVSVWPAAVGPDAVVPTQKLYNGSAPAPATFVAQGINGQPAVQFDGVDDLLSISGFANKYLADKPLTIFLVTQSADGGFGICGNGLNGNGGNPRLYLTRSGFHYDVLNKPATLATANDRPSISTYTHDGRETISVYADGLLKDQQAGLPPVEQFGGGHLALPFWGANKGHAGTIAEIVVFSRQLSDDELQGVTAFLAEKYGIRHQQRWR